MLKKAEILSHWQRIYSQNVMQGRNIMDKNDKPHSVNPELENDAHEISDGALDQVSGGFLSAGQIILKRCNYCGQTTRHKVLVNLGGYYRMRCEDCGADYCDDF